MKLSPPRHSCPFCIHCFVRVAAMFPSLHHELHDIIPSRAVFFTPRSTVVPSAGFEAELGARDADAAGRRPCRRSSCSLDHRTEEADGLSCW